MNFRGAISIIGGSITILGGIIGGWIALQNTITGAVNTGVGVVTKELQSSTVDIVGEFLRDMKLRHQLMVLEIDDYKSKGLNVPDRLIMHERLLAGQIAEVEKKWLED
jgi:hypothetical protein